MNTAKKKNFLINFTYLSAIILISYFAFKYLFFPLLPFAIAFMVASTVQKSAAKLENRIHIKKSVASLLLVLIIYAAIFLILILIGSAFSVSFETVKNFIVDLFSHIGRVVLEWKTVIENYISENFGEKVNIDNVVTNSATDFAGELIGKLSQAIISLFSKIPQIILNIIVTVVASCYVAVYYDKLKKFISSLIKTETKKKILKIRDIFKTSILTIIGGYLLLMLITFSELLIGFFILGVNTPVLFASVIAVVDILPVLGTGTVLLPWAIFSFLSGERFFAVGIIILYVLITVFRNFLEPHIIGKKLGLNPLLMLIAIFVGLKLFGVVGLFATPILLIIVYEYNRSSNTDTAI